jgi:hypothetical protein
MAGELELLELDELVELVMSSDAVSAPPQAARAKVAVAAIASRVPERFTSFLLSVPVGSSRPVVHEEFGTAGAADGLRRRFIGR